MELQSQILPPDPQEVWISEGIFVRELHNCADDPAVSIARCRLPAGHTTEPHRLRVDERYIVEAGSGVMVLGDTEFPVSTGDRVTIPAGMPQSIHNSGDDMLVFLTVCTPRFTPDCYKALSHSG